MKFSIVIPLYNGADFIEATLDTVLAQTHSDYEIILVNDNSPDNVGDIVKKYISLHQNIKFIYLEQENRGLGGARNTAIRHASGEVIAILDQDDSWYPNKLERIAGIYNYRPEAGIICHSQVVRKNGKIIGIFHPLAYTKDIYRELLFYNNRLSTSAVTFKKEIIDDVGYFTEDKNNFHFVEDYDLWLRMAKKGYRFYFSDEILGEYNRHGANFSTQLEIMFKSELNVLQKHYQQLTHNTFWDDYLMQRRMALLHLRLSRNYLNQKCLLGALKHVAIAGITDPFFISYFFEKLWFHLNKFKLIKTKNKA